MTNRPALVFSLLLVLAMQTFPLPASELAPALAPLAATHRAEAEKLAKEREAAVRSARDAYLADLGRANEEATSEGDQELLAAITKESRQVERGGAMPLPPAQFPRKLQSSHKAFMKAVEKVDAGIGKKRKDLNSRYLMALARIQPKPGEEEVLADQIAREKERLLSGTTGPIADLRTQLKGTRWQSIKDPEKIHHFKQNGYFNEHWRFTTPELDEVIIHWNENSRRHLKLAKDGKTLTAGGLPDMILLLEQTPKE